MTENIFEKLSIPILTAEEINSLTPRDAMLVYNKESRIFYIGVNGEWAPVTTTPFSGPYSDDNV